jgi:hypothetical protein
MSPRILLATFFASGVLAGCAGNQIERLFTTGQYVEVTRVFEAESALHDQEGALYRAGLAYAFPGTTAYDPDRAAAAFERLVELYPTGTHTAHAVQLLHLLDETQRLHQLLRLREEEIARLARELQSERDELDAIHDRLTAEQGRADELHAIADRLNREIRSRNARIRELEDELSALKEIDLNRPPPGTGIEADTTATRRP